MTVRLAGWLRAAWSVAPLLGLVPRPDARPRGITAMVRVRGEEEWIEPCLLSLRGFADEILVLDNGAAPGTRAALERMRDPLGDLLRLERCPDLDLFQLSNLGLAKARFQWVIRWDADFVAHTSGPGEIGRLRGHLLGLDRRRYYLVHVAAAELAGDLAHQFPDRRLRLDGQAHVASDLARFVPVRRRLAPAALATPDRVLRSAGPLRVRLEALAVPKFYRILRWREVAYFHVDVKSARHTLLRHFWLEWLGREEFEAYPTLEAFARAEARARWGTTDLEEAARAFMTEYCRGLVPFDPERCGPYPELMRPYLARPRYRVEYRGGEIVGRAEAA